MENQNNREFFIGQYSVKTIVTDELWAENCYLVTHNYSGEQILIDPGCEGEKISEVIRKTGNGQLSRILLTHAHFDHVGATSSLSKGFGPASEIHQADSRLLRHVTMYALRFGKKLVYPPDFVSAFENDFYTGTDNIKINFLLTPGHTKGSGVYLFNGFAFTGDTLLCRHVGRTDLPGGNSEQLYESIDLLLKSIPGDFILFPGHGVSWEASEAFEWWQSLQDLPPEYKTFL